MPKEKKTPAIKAVKKAEKVAPVKKEAQEVTEPKMTESEALAAFTFEDAVFDSSLTKTAESALNTEQDIQALAVSAIIDCSKRKEALRMNRLIRALPDAMRKNPLRQFFETFGACRYDEQGKQLVYDRTRRPNVHGAANTLWSRIRKEREYHGFDMLLELAGFYNKCSKKLKKAKEGDRVSIEAVNQLGAFIAELKLKAPENHPVNVADAA